MAAVGVRGSFYGAPRPSERTFGSRAVVGRDEEEKRRRRTGDSRRKLVAGEEQHLAAALPQSRQRALPFPVRGRGHLERNRGRIVRNVNVVAGGTGVLETDVDIRTVSRCEWGMGSFIGEFGNVGGVHVPPARVE